MIHLVWDMNSRFLVSGRYKYQVFDKCMCPEFGRYKYQVFDTFLVFGNYLGFDRSLCRYTDSYYCSKYIHT